MKKIAYIIPGFGESCKEAQYKKLAVALRTKGYVVNCVNPDWYRPISKQIFQVEKDAVVFGFSIGAVLAYLIAKKFPYRKAIFASISPIHKFSFKNFKSALHPYMSNDLATEITIDIKSIKVSLKNLKVPHVTLVGQLEKKMPQADFIVPKTGHRITTSYINCISKLI